MTIAPYRMQHRLRPPQRSSRAWWRPPRIDALRQVRRRGTLVLEADGAPEARAWTWFVDGRFHARTRTPRLGLALAGLATVEVFASRHADLDPQRWANRPGRPALSRLHWVRPDADVDSYMLEYAEGQSGGTWVAFARVPDDGRWAYSARTPRLAGGQYVRFRVTPVRNGNLGTPTEWPPVWLARVPDVPPHTITYDDATGQVTIAAV